MKAESGELRQVILEECLRLSPEQQEEAIKILRRLRREIRLSRRELLEGPEGACHQAATSIPPQSVS